MADADALGDDHTTFIQVEGMPVLSRAAIQLHAHGIVNSIQDGQPGFVCDDYLNAIAAETTTTVLELEATGMWERRNGGYLIIADDMVKAAINFHERTDRQEAECAQRGKHLPDDSGSESGWVICSHCGIPLKRPDSGPVALPDGGPLGPDPARKTRDHAPSSAAAASAVFGAFKRPTPSSSQGVLNGFGAGPGREPTRQERSAPRQL